MLTLDFLSWAARALSFFNTITLLWLGLTVLLNAERRTWGTWVIGGGSLLGGLFFVGHSAVVGAELTFLSADMAFWWQAIWLLFIAPPYQWYLAIAWYTGTLGAGRHRAWLVLVTLIGLSALALLVLANPLPSYGEVLQQSSSAILTVAGLPVAVLIYPVYSGLCFVLALSMLRRPETSERFMGDLARRRARPWLIGASFVLLGVSLAVGSMAAWFLHAIQTQQIAIFSPEVIIGFDVLISSLLAAVTVLVGQAIVSYEVFTGKALPRGGLFHHWRNCLILAAGYGISVGAFLGLPVDPIYRLLLSTVLLTVFYALLSWRSYAEREQGVARLRPFVASQRLYEHLVRPAAPVDVDTAAPFQALCNDILGARVGFLAALGPLAPLAGQVLAYPSGAVLPSTALAGIVGRLGTPQTICVPVDPSLFGGAVWAVPLWSERGLTGVLLLGDKRDGRLYAQEEIEIARAAAERLIDTRASAEMAERLMALQRQRLSESQVLDRTARRVLHDDVLPRLHTALLTLSGTSAGEGSPEVMSLLADAHRSIANLMQAMPSASAPEVARLGLVDALRHVVDSEMRGAFDSVAWRVEPDAGCLVRSIPTLTAEVMFFAAREAVRNAARHGRAADDARPLNLAISVACDGGLQISVEDDGVGLSAEAPSTSGAGQGLALHGTMMAVIGGTLTAESAHGLGTRVRLTLPWEPSMLPPGQHQR